MHLDLTQRKRSYTSDYGYGNVREVLLGEQDRINSKVKIGISFILDNIIAVVEEESW